MKENTTQPQWLTVKGAARYSGLTARTIQNYIRAGVVKSTAVVIPGKCRGRRLINRQSLDGFIEQGIGMEMKNNFKHQPIRA